MCPPADVMNVFDQSRTMKDLEHPPSPQIPAPDLPAWSHFSSLLFSGSKALTTVEMGLLTCLSVAAIFLPPSVTNVKGSMTLMQMSIFLWVSAITRRLYNTYCETVFFKFPQYRIQPDREHALASSGKDLCGREKKQLELLEWHDLLTMLSQFVLEVSLYFTLPGYFPAAQPHYGSWWERLIKLLLNHYVMSFAMYWMHRALHVVPFLWEHIHSIHHYARHPLSRNTYQDHWLDNMGNAIVGHVTAQILVPLDFQLFWFSHIFRIFESLEKHAGTSCYFNIAHSIQRWLPFAQMPHHHDWHHEGHKACNFTFTSIGGVWDCVFGTRKAGRGTQLQCKRSSTREDAVEAGHPGSPKMRKKSYMDQPIIVCIPVLAVVGAALCKLYANAGIVGA